ncbi:MAG: S8 family serine peptidase [Dehalococcoidia bacterium]
MIPENGSQQDPTPAGTAETTGRYVIVFNDPDASNARMLRSTAGVAEVADSRDFDDQLVDPSEGDATVFAELGIAVSTLDPSQLSTLRTAVPAQAAIASVSPELIHHALAGTGYVAGYLDGAADLAGRLGGDPLGNGSTAVADRVGIAQFADSNDTTWGTVATRASTSPTSGKGIRVAVLDTGFDANHPDFVGRNITMASFISGESAQDGHGHGTHCIGTACGPKNPAGTRRYGVAYESDIFVGKVLSNAGSGSDAAILAGINWAVGQGCHVISMSLGANTPQAHPPYTSAGRVALDKGTLIIAAAGNNADRAARNFGFVGAPANSPFIVAVGAVEEDLSIAFFSARTLFRQGGGVDLAAPGRRVFSSWPMPQRYHTISGTSMATPHVSGVAALLAQQSGMRGRELWSLLVQEADRLFEPSVDVGSGLVVAPQ